MTPKLTDEMREALHRSQGRPVVLQDSDGATYVLVPKDAYVYLDNLRTDADETTRAQLRTLIQEGIDSGPGIPAENAFAQLRDQARQLDDSHS